MMQVASHNTALSKLKITALAVIVYTVFLLLIGSAKASAAPVVDLIPDGVMPVAIEQYLLSCGGTNNAAAQIGWISLRGQGTTTIKDIVPGTTSVDLQYNVAGIVCRSGSMGGLTSTNNGIIATQPANLNITGSTVGYSYGNTNGAYSIGVLNFTYTNPAGFFTSTDITMTITEKRINTYTINPKYRCVTNAGDVNFRTPNSSTDFAACRSSGKPLFTIRLNVVAPRPVVVCAITSQTITAGTAFAPTVTFTHGGPASAPTVDISGTLAVKDSSGNTVVTNNLSATVANGALRAVNGSSHTYTSPGAFSVIGSFTAMSNQPTVSVPCSGTLTVTVPAPKVSCIVTSAVVLVGDSHALAVRVSHDGPQYAPSINYSAKITIASQSTQTLNGSLSSGTAANLATASYTYPTAGIFMARVDITGTVATSCEGKVSVLTGPYIRTYGNDVQAGGGFANSAGSCATGTGDVLTLNRGAAGNYAGSGSQLGVFARNLISGFRSASTRADATTVPAALSFANTVTGPLLFGGQFGTNMCMTDFWSGRPQQNPTVMQSINLSTFWDPARTAYLIRPVNAANPVEITGEIPNGRRIALYVEGDVVIKKSNASGHVGYASTSWGTIADIPSLYVIALGNIGIASDIATIDGQYIAQSSTATNGRITTCVNPATAQRYVDDAQYIASCGVKLTVNGTLSAVHINFLRLFSTVGAATPGESPTANNAAEVIRYDIAALLGRQPTPATGNQTYDSITALPPSL